MSTITLTDAAGTPVNHTYTLVDRNGEITTYRELTDVNVVDPKVTVSIKENASGTVRMTAKLVHPYAEADGGGTTEGFEAAPKKAFECIASCEYVFPSRAVLQHRKDLNALFKDLLSDAIITSAVESFIRPGT
ncbi:TPA_asm: coat protein [ssRNA phage Esthiorhiza.1_9]|uniref:Coat protein n=2 Tax=Fiersviridae TaxID=2842319 RepID=A0A8S5L3H4_9VIRU|nr:coat protein [ssRNA phage Esthiorhiza.1_9]QDH89697.1 MAG: hypothetical protein H1RhizoLitter1388_000002 [Leviviridae sp.]DAD52217.1 TPA_asm: coat protein [ssRNA phage Esthiorhiza.1_9]